MTEERATLVRDLENLTRVLHGVYVVLKTEEDSTANGYDDLAYELEQKIEWVISFIEKEYPTIKEWHEMSLLPR